MNWVEKYMRIPYTQEGSSFQGCNCWGLVKLIFQEEKDIQLPGYVGISASDILRAAKQFKKDAGIPPWQTVIEPGQEQPFDVLVMRALNEGHAVNMHAGIVTEFGMVVHLEARQDVSHVPFRDSPRGRQHYTLKNRVVGVFRHEALTCS